MDKAHLSNLQSGTPGHLHVNLNIMIFGLEYRYAPSIIHPDHGPLTAYWKANRPSCVVYIKFNTKSTTEIESG